MKSVIVLSVSAWGAVFIFPEAALDLTVSSRLLEGALLYLAFASASRFRKAASPASDTLTHFGSGEASAS